MVWKQVVVVRKDLNMSPGKLAAQVSHASMAFLTRMIQKQVEVFYDLDTISAQAYHPLTHIQCMLSFETDLYTQWIANSFVKIIVGAKNKNKLYKAVDIAKELGLKEDIDYFLIKDNCLTELEPEENGTTLTCIGFRPMPEEQSNLISKKFQLLH